MDGVLAAAHAMRDGVEREIGHAQRPRTHLWLPPPQGPQARQQLGEGEGLGQVVVGARVESRNAILDGAQRRQEQNGQAATGGPGGATDAQPVAARQAYVEHHDIVAVVLRGQEEVERHIAVSHQIDDVQFLAQAVHDLFA